MPWVSFNRPCGTQSCCMMYPGLASWATFRRPLRLSVKFWVLAQPLSAREVGDTHRSPLGNSYAFIFGGGGPWGPFRFEDRGGGSVRRRARLLIRNPERRREEAASRLLPSPVTGWSACR